MTVKTQKSIFEKNKDIFPMLKKQVETTDLSQKDCRALADVMNAEYCTETIQLFYSLSHRMSNMMNVHPLINVFCQRHLRLRHRNSDPNAEMYEKEKFADPFNC